MSYMRSDKEIKLLLNKKSKILKLNQTWCQTLPVRSDITQVRYQ